MLMQATVFPFPLGIKYLRYKGSLAYAPDRWPLLLAHQQIFWNSNAAVTLVKHEMALVTEGITQPKIRNCTTNTNLKPHPNLNAN